MAAVLPPRVRHRRFNHGRFKFIQPVRVLESIFINTRDAVLQHRRILSAIVYSRRAVGGTRLNVAHVHD